MGRIYTVPMISVSISAQQDLFTVKSGANSGLRILELRLGQSNEAGDANEDDWSFIFQQLVAGYTAGSGGNAVTPVARNPTDVASSFTARINDTTGATGTITHAEGDAWNVRVPYRQVWMPESAPYVPAGGAAWNVTLTKTPKAATTVSGTLIVQEGD